MKKLLKTNIRILRQIIKEQMKTLSFLLLMMTSFIVAAQDGAEIAKFDQEVIHLGKVEKGSTVSKVFTFTNISDEDIQIDMVSTCECTEAKWTVSKVPPGEKGKVEFTFNSNKKEEVEPVDVDVYFFNENPKTGNPYSIYLQYTFEYD